MKAGDAFKLALDRVTRGENLGRSARAFAAYGIPVFPCAPGGKRPAVTQGFHSASTSADLVDRWWRAMPTANIGMPTGAASSLVVIDVDVHGTVNGYAALDRARHQGLLDGWLAAVRTPSGGLHLYFSSSDGADQRSWQSARTGIDFRGDGGYIVLPPAARMVDGSVRHYDTLQVTSGTSSPLDAQRLRHFLDPPRRSVIPRSDGTSMTVADVTRLAAWVSRLHEGERNHGLFWAACKLAEQRVSTSEALDTLLNAAATAGLSEREVVTTVRSAYRTVHGSPTQRLPSNASATSPYRSRPVTESRTLA